MGCRRRENLSTYNIMQASALIHTQHTRSTHHMLQVRWPYHLCARVLLENMHTAELSREEKRLILYMAFGSDQGRKRIILSRWDVMLPSEYIIIVIKCCSLDGECERPSLFAARRYFCNARLSAFVMNAQNERRRPLWLTPHFHCQSPLMHHARAEWILWPLGRADGQTQIIIEKQVVFYCTASRTLCRYTQVNFAPDESSLCKL